jgi:hypothetical protein
LSKDCYFGREKSFGIFGTHLRNCSKYFADFHNFDYLDLLHFTYILAGTVATAHNLALHFYASQHFFDLLCQTMNYRSYHFYESYFQPQVQKSTPPNQFMDFLQLTVSYLVFE